MEVFIYAGLSIAFFAAVTLATKRNQTISDKILAIWLFLYTFDYSNLAFTSFASDFHYVPSSLFLINPALYFYSKSLTDRNFKLSWKLSIHLIPYFFFEASKWFFPFSMNSNSYFNTDSTLWIRLLFAITLIISLFVYNILSVRTVHKHRINLKHIFSNISENHLITWVYLVLFAYITYVVILVTLGLTGFLNNNLDIATHYNYISSWLLIFMLGFYGIRQEEIIQRVSSDKPELETIDSKYKTSGLSKRTKREIKDNILYYFEKEKPFLNSDLNMPMLSDLMNIPKHQLTEVLNTEIGKNFFQFVNEYRVKAVQEKLNNTRNDNYSIEAIGYDCGFSSKSSFFAVFKSITGVTPLQYRKSTRFYQSELNKKS